jgi:hypothetical protein
MVRLKPLKILVLSCRDVRVGRNKGGAVGISGRGVQQQQQQQQMRVSTGNRESGTLWYGGCDKYGITTKTLSCRLMQVETVVNVGCWAVCGWMSELG